MQDMQQALAQAEQQRHSRSQATIVRDMKQALVQAEQQLAQTQAQLQQTIPAQQGHCQLVQQLQAMQCACWNCSLSAELSGLVLGKTSRYIERMVAASCLLLRDTANAAREADKVRDFAVVTSADRSWSCSHDVRECGRACVRMGRE